jgi:hypothetical protein
MPEREFDRQMEQANMLVGRVGLIRVRVKRGGFGRRWLEV